MAQKRSDFYKSLNEMRDANQTLGNPLINNIDDSTSVGSELSSFAYNNVNANNDYKEINWDTTTAYQNELNDYSSNRNWWQKLYDTSQNVVNKVGEGFLNFIDGILDAGAYVVGMVGDEKLKQDVQSFMNTDWQQYALGVSQQLSVNNALMTGDLFSNEYWQNWASIFNDENGARKLLDKTANSSYINNELVDTTLEGVGYVLPSIIVGIATGGASAGVQTAAKVGMLTATGLSAFGSGTTEALNDNATYQQAGASGLVSGAIELGTEALSFGAGKIAGKILGKVGTYGTRIGAATFGQQLGKLTVKEIGKAALEEGTEEFISELLSPLAKQVYKDDALQEAWLNVGSEENLQMWQNAFTSFIAGAVGGAVGSSVQGAYVQSKIGKKGIEIANLYNEAVKVHEQAIKEGNKGSRANQSLISDYENKIGEMSKELVSSLEAYQKSNPTEFYNLMEMIKSPEEFIKSIKENNPNLTKEQVNYYKKSYIENYQDIINYLNEDTYSKIAKLNSTNDSEIVIGKAQDFDTKNFTKEFLKENGIVDGEELRAYYDKDTKTTLINPKYKAQFYEIIAHENLSHAILDTNENVRKQLIDKISKNEKLNALFHKNDAEIKKLYGKQGENVVNSERLASFLENFIKDQKTYNQVLKIGQGNKILAILNKLKNKFSRNLETRFLNDLENAIEKVKTSIEPRTNSYTPRLAFSKVYNEQGKATGTEVHADIIKDAAQGLQDRFINLNSVEDIYNNMYQSLKEALNADIKMNKSKYYFARETFVDFNTLLNNPEELKVRLADSIDQFLQNEVVFKREYLLEDNNREATPLDQAYVLTLEKVLKETGLDMQAFKEESVLALSDALLARSHKTKIFKLKEFYHNIIQEMQERISYYQQVSNDVIKLKAFWDSGKKFIEDNKARATKVGDSYVSKINFYKDIFKGTFSYSKSFKNISPATITTIVNGLDGYNEANITKIGGVWTTIEEMGERDISNESIRNAADFLKSHFEYNPQTKTSRFPNRSATLEELEAVRTILNGIKLEMKELTTKEGIARRKALEKADTEIKAIDLSNFKDKFNKKSVLRTFENELNYTSSMDSVLANLFGADSDIHHILYDNVFNALDNKYLQEARMRNELQSILEKYDMWSKTTSSPKVFFNKVVDFNGDKITRGQLMDIYAETLTSKGLATLQKGGYVYRLDKENVNKHIVLDENTLNELENILTNEEKSFVRDLVFNLYNGSWKQYKSDKDNAIRSYTDVLENEVYYPTNKADMSNVANLEENSFQSLDLSNQSFNKRRNANTTHLALRGMGIIERARSYIDGLTKYGEMTQDLKMLDSFLKQWTTDSNNASMSRDSLISKNIPNWNSNGQYEGYKQYLIGQILGTNQGVKQGKLFGNLVAATLYGNISVVFKQTASLPTILLEVSPNAWAKSLMKGWKNLTQYRSTKQFIEAQSGIAAQRWANFDRIAASTLQKNVSRVGKLFGLPMEKMDEGIIVLFGWQAAQEEAKIRGFGNVGTRANQEQAIKILNKIIANTQSNAISLNMSMARSGNAGYVRKVLSYFSSDLQNKVSRLNRILNESKYARERLKGIIELENVAQSNYDAARQELTNLNSISSTVENYDSELERINAELADKQQKLDLIKEIKANELNIIAGDRRAKEALKYVIATFLSALMVSGIEQLISRLYGRKGWNEDTLDEFAKNLLLEATIGNLPYASNIINSIEYDQDIGGYDFTIINSAIDIIKDIQAMVEKGSFDTKALFDMSITLGQLTGIPFKNIYNIIMGVWKNFDGSGYSAEALIKGYSDTYMRKSITENLNNNQVKQATAYLEVLMSSYKVGSSDSSVNNELIRLMQQGYTTVLPKNYLTNYEDNGESKALTENQISDFIEYYGSANKDVATLIKSDAYKNLNDQAKAKLVKKIYDSYYEYAKCKVLNITTTNKLVNVLLKTSLNLRLNKYASILSHLSLIEENGAISRKEQAIKFINSLRGYTKEEKLLIMWLSGYSLTNESKVILGNYLIRNGGKKKDIKELLK